jgi:hypothetical protein
VGGSKGRSRDAAGGEKRRPLGGHELPPEVQDRPEQNAGYDRAVRGGSGATGRRKVTQLPPLPPDEEARTSASRIDDREARRAAAIVRRRDRPR